MEAVAAAQEAAQDQGADHRGTLLQTCGAEAWVRCLENCPGQTDAAEGRNAAHGGNSPWTQGSVPALPR